MTEIMLEQVPSDWLIRRIGELFKERREKASDKEFEPLSVTKAGVVPQLETAAKTDDGDNRKRVRKGDFVINSRSDRKGSGGLSEIDGSVALICIVLEPQEIVPRFAHHLLRSTPFQEEFYRWGHGIVADLWTTRYSEMKNILVAVPDERTQHAIASFLDRETSRIDSLIAKKQRQIELLNEKRAALISRVVTKGLNPDAKMKDSGVEWLGKIPQHWQVTRIGYLAKVRNGSTPSRNRPEYWDGSIPWLSSSKVNEDIVDQPSEWITPLALRECSLEMVPKGSVLIGLIGQGRTRGTTALMGFDATINQNVAAIIPGPMLLGRYLQHVLEHMYEPVRDSGRGANQAALNCEIVSDIRVPFPPLEEQSDIILHLSTTLSHLLAIRSKVSESITFLQEYRTSLITAAVTGKIDVRQEATHARTVH